MKIPAEYLKESNYDGTRLIEITDPRVIKLSKEISKLKEPAEPHLKRMEELSKVLDPIYSQINSHNKEISALREKMGPDKDLFDIEVAALEKIDQKAQLIKNKMQPIVNELIKAELGEFDKPMQVITKEDGKMFVEIQDELEEKIKQIRANKNGR